MEIPSHFKIPQVVKKVSDYLAKRGVESYLVGGALRNLLLGREISDIDIAIKGRALEIAQSVAEALKGKYVLLDEANDAARILLGSEHGQQIDFTGFDDTIEKDLRRRDFTVGAIALNLASLQAGPPAIIDPYHGMEDLDRKLIRAVSDGTFRADPLRLLRAVRLAGEFGFTIEPHTEDLIKHEAQSVNSVAGERLREEILKVLAMPISSKCWNYFDHVGLVKALFPELELSRGISQPKEHHWDVLNHCLMTATATGFLLRQGEWEFAPPEVLDVVPWSDKLDTHFKAGVSSGSTRASLLKLAGLLHDVSKPETKTITDDGRTRFLGHQDLGATVVADILTRLRFSTKEIKLVETLVKNHMRPTQMSQIGPPTAHAIYRYFRDTGDAGLDTLYLSLADHLAARGPSLIPAEWRRHNETVAYIIQQQFGAPSPTQPPKLITGHDLMNAFKLNQGPQIGKILEAVREATATGELKSKEEAIKYVSTLLGTQKNAINKE